LRVVISKNLLRIVNIQYHRSVTELWTKKNCAGTSAGDEEP